MPRLASYADTISPPPPSPPLLSLQPGPLVAGQGGLQGQQLSSGHQHQPEEQQQQQQPEQREIQQQ